MPLSKAARGVSAAWRVTDGRTFRLNQQFNEHLSDLHHVIYPLCDISLLRFPLSLFLLLLFCPASRWIPDSPFPSLSPPPLILLFLTLPVSPVVVFLSDQSQVVASVSHVFHQGCILQTHTLTLPSTHTHTHTEAGSSFFAREEWRERERKRRQKKDGRMMKKETEDDVVFGLNYTLWTRL